MDSRTLGIIGGGWRARLLAQAAHRYGLRTVVLDPAGNASSAGQLAELSIESGLDDVPKIREFASICDAVVVDAEISADIVLGLKDLGCSVYPPLPTLSILQDQLIQRSFFQASGFPLPDLFEVDGVESAFEAGRSFSYPLLLRRRIKSTGRTIAVSEEGDVADALATVGASDVFAEQSVCHARYLIVTILKGQDAAPIFFPLSERLHNGLCLSPAAVEAEIEARANKLAADAVTALGEDCFGVFSVKIFALDDGDVLLGEVSAKPHNSGSASIDVCGMSQYDAMLRLVLGLPLPKRSEDLRYRGRICCGVVPLKQKIIGDVSSELTMINKSLALPSSFGHWYGVSDGIEGQVLGHITIVADDSSQLLEEVSALGVDSAVSAEVGVERSVGRVVAIVANSREDLNAIGRAVKVFEEFEITYDVCIASAQLTPSRVYAFSESVPENGYVAIIATSRGEPHLATMIASMTTVPVIAHIIPDNETRTSVTARGEGCVGRVVSADGLEPAMLATRIAASSRGSKRALNNEACSKLHGKLLQRNADVEANILKDALRLESVGFEQFMNENKNKE